ncbi:unnamed protein product, partial [Laminaria digitata]
APVVAAAAPGVAPLAPLVGEGAPVVVAVTPVVEAVAPVVRAVAPVVGAVVSVVAAVARGLCRSVVPPPEFVCLCLLRLSCSFLISANISVDTTTQPVFVAGFVTLLIGCFFREGISEIPRAVSQHCTR